MSTICVIGVVLLVISSLSAITFAIYIPLLWCLSRLRRPCPNSLQMDEPPPLVTLLVAVRNGEDIIEAKIDNSLSLDYPRDRVQHLFVSDGSSDATVALLEARKAEGIECLELVEFSGKITALNRAILQCRGDIVVFSDADAMLAPDALLRLLPHFQDSAVGGVCGQRVIRDGMTGWGAEGQSAYISIDSLTKRFESHLGSITSNDGKLYAIRRGLYQPISAAVTDDLFVCLSIVQQRYRFVFEPLAIVRVHIPSRNRAHEFERRRRIVSTSLRGIYEHRTLLNPFRFGGYACGLIINKIMRRLLSFYGLVFGVGLGVLALEWPALWIVLLLAVFSLTAVCLWPVGLQWPRRLRVLQKCAETTHYLCLGQVGMLWGVIDFISGRRIIKWEPNKGTSTKGS